MSTPMVSTHSRRKILHLLAGTSSLGLSLGVAPRVWAQAVPAKVGPDNGSSGGRLVVVFLRGAYDGLSAFVPYADKDYYAIRPNIAIAAPDGSTQTAIKLDNTFAMHPSLSPLLPLWQQGVLSFIPAAGLPKPNRSHFDAQYQMEVAQVDKTSGAPGWLNKLSLQTARNAAAKEGSSANALGIGEANPAILAGSATVRLIPRGQAAERTGVLENEKTRQALLDMYSGNDKVSVAFRQGAGSRMQSAQELGTDKSVREGLAREKNRMLPNALDKDGTLKSPQAQNAQMLAASNGAPDPRGLQLDALHLGTLMRNEPKLRIGFLSAGGWDTHVNQGNAAGQLANNLRSLALAIAQLRQDFNQPGDVVVVMSEFGRTSAENGTRGTDHGFGNAMWLVGNRVAGGKWHGHWTGLAKGNLNENRDLPAHHDYRAVLAQVLRGTFALNDTALDDLLPATNWDTRLDGMLRKA